MLGNRQRRAKAPRFDIDLPTVSHNEVQVQNKGKAEMGTFLMYGGDTMDSPVIMSGTAEDFPPLMMEAKKSSKQRAAPPAHTAVTNPAKSCPHFFHVDNTNLFILTDGISMFSDGVLTCTGWGSSCSTDYALNALDNESLEMAMRGIEVAGSPLMEKESQFCLVCLNAPSSVSSPLANPLSSSKTQESFHSFFADAVKSERRPLFKHKVASSVVVTSASLPETPVTQDHSFALNTKACSETSSGRHWNWKRKKHTNEIAMDDIGHTNRLVVLEDVVFKHTIGSGSQGIVYMVELHKKLYAMKIIDVQAVTSTSNASERRVRKHGLMRELQMIKSQNAAPVPVTNLIQMFNAIMKKRHNGDLLYLLMELMWADVDRIGEFIGRLSSSDVMRIAQSAFKEHFAGSSYTKQLEALQSDIRGSCKHVVGRMKFSEPEAWETRIEGQTPFPEIILSMIAADVLMGLKELHEQYQTVHCDLKPGNILLCYDKQSFKLADFGCSRTLDAVTRRVMPGSVEDMGTKLYKSPERFHFLESNAQHRDGEDNSNHGSFGPKADVWSLGVLLLELSCGIHPCYPFKTEYWNYSSMLKLAKMAKPLTWSSGLFDFVLRCTFVDEEERWSVDQLLQHPFILRFARVPRKRLAVFMTRLEADCSNMHMKRQHAWLEEQIRMSICGSEQQLRKSSALWREFTHHLSRAASALGDREKFPSLP